jgi:hypothetical protein
MIDKYLINIGLREKPNKPLVQENETEETPIVKETYSPTTDQKVAERYLRGIRDVSK